jgi:hypothetical protein
LLNNDVIFGIDGDLPEFTIIKLESDDSKELAYAFLNNGKCVRIAFSEEFINGKESIKSNKIGVCTIPTEYYFLEEMNRILMLQNFFTCDWLNNRIKFENANNSELEFKIVN